MDGIFVRLLPELQGEEGVLAPGHVFLNMDLFLVVAQMGESFAANRQEVDLRSGCQMDKPELGISRILGLALQCIRRGSKKVAPGNALERPPPAEVIANGNLKLGRLVLLVLQSK